MGQRYTIPNKVAGEVADGEAVIMDLSAGRYFSSKNSGAVIWNCVEAGLSQSQIGAKVAELYNLDETAAQTETDTFLDKLMANRLIEPSSEAEPQPIEGAPDIATPTGAFESPELIVYEDMQDLIMLDPIHDAAEEGWPMAMPGAGAGQN